MKSELSVDPVKIKKKILSLQNYGNREPSYDVFPIYSLCNYIQVPSRWWLVNGLSELLASQKLLIRPGLVSKTSRSLRGPGVFPGIT